jgi:hypothetical protein
MDVELFVSGMVRPRTQRVPFLGISEALSHLLEDTSHFLEESQKEWLVSEASVEPSSKY